MEAVPLLARVASVMADFGPTWALCGGWAVDIWLGRQTRKHGDVDLTVFHDDQRALFDYFGDGWLLNAHDEHDGDGTQPWDGRQLEFPAHIHAYSDDGLNLDIQLNRRADGYWVFSTRADLRLPTSHCTRKWTWDPAERQYSELVVPTLTPEAVLFYKGLSWIPDMGWVRSHDAADFYALAPGLVGMAGEWLRHAMAALRPDLPWSPAGADATGEVRQRIVARMHNDEIDIDEALVRRLVTEQLPQWASLPLRQVESTGTVNAIFRLGDDMAVRLPRTPRYDDADQDCWLSRLASAGLPLAIPEPLAAGEPDDGYPWRWSVHRWLEGETWSTDRVEDPCSAAREMAGFVRALHELDPGSMSCPPLAATAPLTDSRAVRTAASIVPGVDTARFLTAWEAALQIPPWEGPLVMVHADLLPGNVLVRDGRLAAVIDWGSISYGDPARDLSAAWTLFSGEARAAFISALPFDDDTWARAKALLLRSVSGVVYYARTNPSFADENRRRLMIALDESD